MPNITRPVGLTLRDWADQIVLDLDNYGAFGKLMRDDDWQNWAVQFFNNTTLGRNLPNPYAFKSWRDWAERMAQLLS